MKKILVIFSFISLVIFSQNLVFAKARTSSNNIAKKKESLAPTSACSRLNPGSPFQEPENLFSVNGVLRVNLSYQTGTDAGGNALFCFVLPDGNSSPTLHLKPGDNLLLTITNNTPTADPSTQMQLTSNFCGSSTMDASSVNLHFHGTNVSPICHQDEVIRTVINAGQTFTYNLHIPKDEPPGLYWYHPHVHGLAENAVLGGATGAIIIDGIQDVQPSVAGLPERLLIFRDHLIPGNPTSGGLVPSWDLSLNNVSIPYPNYPTVSMTMKPNGKEFWRILNADADTILDLQLLYDNVPQNFTIVALDSIPIGSQDINTRGQTIVRNHLLLPPASRVELIVTPPSSSVQNAQLVTNAIDAGPDGDSAPYRPVASISLDPQSSLPIKMPNPSGKILPSRFSGLLSVQPNTTRVLFFSEQSSNPNNVDTPPIFFITVNGQTPTLFNANNPPAITTTQGSVEDWVIQNRTLENHEFHMHQIHFLLLAENGVPVADQDQQFYDTFQVPHWSGSGPYPSVTLRMDFRGPDIGNFVYHCHILGHEDAGMMAIIQVLPPSNN